MSTTFWWRGVPMFFAFMLPPVGIIASCIAWFRAPDEARNWTLFSLLTSIVLTGTGLIAALSRV